MKSFKITYNGNSFRFRNLNYEINANSAHEAVEKYYAQFLSSDYFPQDDGSIFDQNGDKVADPGDDYIEYDGGYFHAEEYVDIIELMRESAKKQRIGKLYEQQVDENFYDITCDYEKEPTGLFWSEKDGFFFVPYVKKDNGWKETFLQQNDARFVGYVNAHFAAEGSIDELIDELEEQKIYQ